VRTSIQGYRPCSFTRLIRSGSAADGVTLTLRCVGRRLGGGADLPGEVGLGQSGKIQMAPNLPVNFRARLAGNPLAGAVYGALHQPGDAAGTGDRGRLLHLAGGRAPGLRL